MTEKQAVFRDLSVDFTPCKVHAVIGSSGAGKSTLLNLIARLYVPGRGRIALDGEDVQQMDRDQFLK